MRGKTLSDISYCVCKRSSMGALVCLSEHWVSRVCRQCGFWSPLHNFQLDAAERIWWGWLLGDGGSRKSQNGHQGGVNHQWARSNGQSARHSEHKIELQNIRMAMAPNVHRHRGYTSHINVRYNVHKYNNIIPVDSPVLASSFRAGILKVLQAASALK